MKVKADRERFFAWDDGYPFTSPVGAFQPNQFGLYDMLGNVFEWVADPWHDSYDGAPLDEAIWLTERNESRRVVRGGSWGDYPRDLRAGVRDRLVADDRNDVVGFRLARTL
jgi:formylglycine-generating enzyme required for sulfatase activity